MSYIDLINNFWRIDEQQNYNGNQTRLYFYLLSLANRFYWIEWFCSSDERTAANVGISVNAMKTARERLKATLLIDYIPGGKGHGVKTRYHILQPIYEPTQHANAAPYNYKTKTKENNKSLKKTDYGKRSYIASGSDFD